VKKVGEERLAGTAATLVVHHSSKWWKLWMKKHLWSLDC